MDRFFLPVRSGVAPPEGLPSPAELVALPTDFEWMAEHGPALRERFAELY